MNVTSESKTEEKQFGKYTILEFLGKGGMAEVYKAKLKGVGGFEKILVIKKILEKFSSSENFIKMFCDEAKITVALHHPNIVQVFELGETDGIYYMSMEYVNGCNLNSLIGKIISKKARLPFKHLIFIIMEVCKALYYAHKAIDSNGVPLNIIHRDVTPSNILISYTGDVKLADFGIARARIQEAKEKPGVLKGKLGYMAPELIRGEEIDHRADIYSLGVVFLEALMLRRLFKGEKDEDVIRNILTYNIEKTFEEYPTIPQEVQDILKKAMAIDRNSRYSSAHEFYMDLNDYIFNNRIQVSPHEFSEFVCKITKGENSFIAPEETVSRTSQPEVSKLLKVDTTSSEVAIGSDPNIARKVQIDKNAVETVTSSKKIKIPVEFEGKPQYEGEFKSFLLPRAIFRISAARLNGKLKIIMSEDKIGIIFFNNGNIQSVISNQAQEELQKYIIEITTAELEEIEKAAKEAQGDYLGMALVKNGKLQPEELERCLYVAYNERLANMVNQESGKIEFYKGNFQPPSSFLHPEDSLKLLSEAIRKSFDATKLVKALGKYYDRKIILQDAGKISIKECGLYPEEIEFIKHLLNSDSLRNGLLKLGPDEKRLIALRAVYILHQYEFLKFSKT